MLVGKAELGHVEVPKDVTAEWLATVSPQITAISFLLWQFVLQSRGFICVARNSPNICFILCAM